jgi:hypothetical protein
MVWYAGLDTPAASPPAATEATLATLKPAVDLVKTAVDATTAAANGTTAAVNAQKAALLAALGPLATEATLALIAPAVNGLKGSGNKTLTDIVTALAPLAAGATEATLAQVNAKLATVNTDNTAMRAALAALQTDSATMVGRVYNNHATQRVAAGATVNIPAGTWRTLSVLYVPTTAGATINGASFDGMSLTSNLMMYEGSYTVTTNATTLVAIVAGNCDVFITRTF